MALIKTINEIKGYLAVSRNMDMEGVMPYLTDAEEQYLIPLIGQELYDRIDTAYQGAIAPGSADDKLLKKIQRPLANIAFWIYLPIGNVHIGNDGVQIVSTQDTKMAFEWQYDKVLKSFATSGMNGLESLLAFLESNIADYPEYAASQERTANNALLINTGAEFSRYYGINNSRLTYICLRPIITRIESDRAAVAMGDYYAAIKAKLQAGTALTEAEASILRAARYALAFATIAEAIPQLSVEISPQGLAVNYVSAANNLHYKSSPSSDRLEKLQAYASGKADQYFQDVVDLVTPPDEGDTGAGWNIDNAGKKIVFI